jgi:VWFA-related protein
MVAPNKEMKAEIVVDYAPVTIAGREYMCPVKGVAFSMIPLNSAAARNASRNVRGVPTHMTFDQSLGPSQIRLNDIAFTNYHEFRAEARIVTNPSGSGDSSAPGGEEAPPADMTASAAPGASSPTVPSPSNSAEPATEEAAKAPLPASDTPNGAPPAAESAASSSAPGAAPGSSAGTTSETETAGNTPAASEASSTPDVSVPVTALRTQSNLVLVDVVVTDHGKPVKGLDRSRFHVFDDGHEQKVSSFEESAPANPTPAVVRPPALPPDTYTNLPAYPDTGAVNVLLLDGLNTEATDKLYVRREMIRYLKTLPPGQEIAIFTLGAKLRLIQGFTADTGKLLAMLADKKTAAPESLRQSAEQKTEDQTELDQLTDAEVSPQDIADIQDFMNEAEEQQTQMRVDMTMEALQDMARYLSGIPGRKNLIWFSGSFPLQFFAIASGPLDQIRLNADGSVSEEVRDTSDLLAAERIAVYPVDARGVLGQSMFDATTQAQNYTRPTAVSSIGGGTSRFSQDTQLAALTTDSEHSSMNVLAQETGGRAVYDSNGLKEALADALSDGSSFYSFSYVPPERKNGQTGVMFHTVEVKVDGSKYQLAYRRGYYTEDPNKKPESEGKIPDVMVKAAVEGTPPSTEIQFQARVLPEGEPGQMDAAPDDDVAGEKSKSFAGGTRRYEVDLHVPLQALSLSEGNGGAVLAQLRSVLVAYSEDGQEVNSVGRAFHFDLPADQYRKLIATGGAISARLSLDLPVRGIALRVVVYDPASAKTGSMEIPIPGAGDKPRSQAKSSVQ